MDEDGTVPSGVEWWLDDPTVAGLVAVSFFDGAAKAAQTRSYSSGVALGELPELKKDGAKFLGWYTAPDGAGMKVTATTAASSSVKTLYAAWQALAVAISPASATLGAGAGNGSFTVTANGAWTSMSTSPWITLNTTAGENDGTVSFTVAANATTAAKSDTDGDGFTAAEEYVMGTDPNDPESRLTASIEFVNGKPVITYTPNLLDDRKYVKWGKKDLADPTEEWVPVPEGREDDYNFFKVSVEMP